ncbi:MAG: DUF1573 domain-containing protein [Pseudobacteriovorax sp.]|nr:DUF1573 domain-containing protein [Pseudobacteriovorax sp.]
MSNMIHILVATLLGQMLMSSLGYGSVTVVEKMNEKRGRIKFDKHVVDFGNVARGRVFTHNFTFHNRGDGVLRIHGVHGGCGCTAIEFEKGKVYRKGDKGQIRVTLDTSNFSGKLSKVVTVLTNDRRQRVHLLTVKANIQNDILVQPPLIAFGSAFIGRDAHRQVKLSGVGQTRFIVERLVHSKNIESNIRQVGRDWILDIYLKPASKVGKFREVVVAETNHQHLKKIKIPITADVVGAVKSQPDYIEFGALAKAMEEKRKIILNSAAPFKVNDVRISMFVNGKKVDAKDTIALQLPENPRSENEITVSITNNEKHNGSVYGDIEVSTDLPTKESIKVGFYAFFRE